MPLTTSAESMTCTKSRPDTRRLPSDRAFSCGGYTLKLYILSTNSKPTRTWFCLKYLSVKWPSHFKISSQPLRVVGRVTLLNHLVQTNSAVSEFLNNRVTTTTSNIKPSLEQHNKKFTGNFSFRFLALG